MKGWDSGCKNNDDYQKGRAEMEQEINKEMGMFAKICVENKVQEILEMLQDDHNSREDCIKKIISSSAGNKLNANPYVRNVSPLKNVEGSADTHNQITTRMSNGKPIRLGLEKQKIKGEGK